MLNLESLIYDRTNDDLTNETSKAYIDYNDLNRIEGACEELAALLKVAIQTKVWKITDWRTETEMERIRANLEAIQNVYDGIKNTAVPPKITYSSIWQANDIEMILRETWLLYKAAESGKQKLAFKLGTKAIGNRRNDE